MIEQLVEAITNYVAVQGYYPVVGINGLDCSGKTTLARNLEQACNSAGIQATVVHVDDYNNDAVQNQVYKAHSGGEYSKEFVELYYNKSIKYNDLERCIKEKKELNLNLIILEGVFLYRPPLTELLDLKVFLKVNSETARARYSVRKVLEGDQRPISVFDDIWLPAYQRYCREYKPESEADLVFCT